MSKVLQKNKEKHIKIYQKLNYLSKTLIFKHTAKYSIFVSEWPNAPFTPIVQILKECLFKKKKANLSIQRHKARHPRIPDQGEVFSGKPGMAWGQLLAWNFCG